MSDTSVTIACVAVCIAMVACVMAWNAMSHAMLVRKNHERLCKEFWRQSHQQAKENGQQWGFQIRQAEWLREHLVSVDMTPRKPKNLPN